jgi:hypothetical protein
MNSNAPASQGGDVADEAAIDALLFSLELRIAQRADILARGRPVNRGSNLGYWLHAEHEVLHSTGLLQTFEAYRPEL